MKKMLRKLLPPVLGVCLFTSAASGLSVHIDDSFDTSIRDNFWTSTKAEGTYELRTQDPDGTSNNSVWIKGGNIAREFDDGWSALDAAPSDEEPLIWRVRMYDYMDEPEGATGVYAELRAIHGESWQATLFAVGILNPPYDNYEIRMYPTQNWVTLEAPRSEGWHTFTFVIRSETFDVYVDEDPYQAGSAPNPNAHALSWDSRYHDPVGEGDFGFKAIHVGGASSRTGEAFLFDDIYLANDPALKAVFDITEHPAPLTVAVGDEAGFLVTVADEGVSYQWQKDEVDLADGARITGATTDALTISPVTLDDAGFYQVVVSDGTDSLSSRRASLTVHPFLFTQQPTNNVVDEGGDSVMTVVVHGQGPFTYQWQKDGVDLVDGGTVSGATTDTLTITGVQNRDNGAYTVVIQNAHGERTSAAASLSVAPLPTGVRFADFEEFDAPSANGVVMFRQPSFSGSSRGLLASPDVSQVVSNFPAGTWGSRVMRLNFAFDPDYEPTAADPYPWLRYLPHVPTVPTDQILRNPIIGFDRYFVFDVHSNEDVYIALSVRESNATGEYGETSAYTGDFQFVGGSADDPGAPGHPQKGVLVKAGSWQKVVFDMPNEFVKPGLVGGDDKLDGAKGMLESLAIRPFTDEDGNYPSVYDIYFDNFEVTEVKPVIVDPDAEGPAVTISRSATGEIELLIEGEPETEYTIESVNDLGDAWTSLGTETTDASGNATFTDSGAGDAPRRFYRIVLP